MAFKSLVILCLCGLTTTQLSSSNVTTSHVTLPDRHAGGRFENGTTNGSDWFDIEEQEEKAMFSAAYGTGRNLLETIDSYVYQIYIPITLILRTFTCVITILVLRKNVFRSSAAVYINGMAVANLLSGIVYVLGIYEKFDTASTNRYWKDFYSYYVSYIFAFNHVGIAANTWTICAFAVERVLAIYHPLKAISGESRAKKVVICIFCASFFINAARFFRYAVKIEIDPVTSETKHVWYYTELGANKLYTEIQYFSSGITVVVLPILLLSVINVLIIMKLRRTDRKQLGLKEGMVDSINNRTGQIERVLIASTSAFLICNIMSATIYITVAARGLHVFRKFIFEFRVRLLVSSMLNALNPSLNFFLYVYCSKALREAVKGFLRIKACRPEIRQPTSSSLKWRNDSCRRGTNNIVWSQNDERNKNKSTE